MKKAVHTSILEFIQIETEKGSGIEIDNVAVEVEDAAVENWNFAVKTEEPVAETDPWSVTQPSDPEFSPAPSPNPKVASNDATPDAGQNRNVATSPASPKPVPPSPKPVAPTAVAEPQVMKVDESAAKKEDTEQESENGEGVSEMTTLFNGILSRLRQDRSCLTEFGSEDFLDRILSIIESNIYDLNICTLGLEILRGMCRFNDDVRNENTKNVALLGKLGACHVVINCIKVHGANDAEIAAIGMSTVRNLASSNAGNIKLFGDLGACLLAQQMLAAHGFANPNAGKASLGGIANLCFLNPSNRSALGKAGACPTIIDVIKAHGFADVNFAKLGLAAIINLAGTSTNKTLFCECNACETVPDLISYFSKIENPNSDVPLHGSWAMLSLIDNSPDNVTAFKKLKAPKVLVECVIDNPNITNKGAKQKAQEVVEKLES